MTPTRIYVESVLPLAKAGLLKGCAHITGGGLIENPPRAIAEGLAPRFDWNAWTLPPVFAWLQKTGGVAEHETAPHLQLRRRLPADRRRQDDAGACWPPCSTPARTPSSAANWRPAHRPSRRCRPRRRTGRSRSRRSRRCRSRARSSRRRTARRACGWCPSAALAGLVAPITSRYRATASSPSSTCTTTGAEVMNSTSSPKNGRSLWTS